MNCGQLSGGDRLATPTERSGSSSAVERQLPKLDVTGSIPVSRSNISTGSNVTRDISKKL